MYIAKLLGNGLKTIEGTVLLKIMCSSLFHSRNYCWALTHFCISKSMCYFTMLTILDLMLYLNMKDELAQSSAVWEH